MVEMLSHHRWNRGGASSVLRKLFFFFFWGRGFVHSRKCQREGGKECQELGPRIFLTLPKVDSGKVHDLRGKNNSTRIEGHFSIELYSQEATHHIPHHSRQVPRVNWDTILSSPKKKKIRQLPSFLSHVSQTANIF
jgi:hypothetical protein